MEDALNQLFNQKPDTIFMIAAILALPWILAAIYREAWGPTFKSLATIAVCFAVTGGWLIFHEFSGSKWAVYAAVLIGGTQLVFFAMKPGIKALEARTG